MELRLYLLNHKFNKKLDERQVHRSLKKERKSTEVEKPKKRYKLEQKVIQDRLLVVY